MMKRDYLNNGDGLPSDLVQTRKHFEEWRQQNGSHRRRIPESLWDEAARLARQHSVHRVAKTLRLDYVDLKERSSSKAVNTKPAAMPFVELLMPQGQKTSETVIELVGSKGTRMSIRHPNYGNKDILDLAQLFLKERS